MPGSINIWQLLAGVAFFLLAMKFLEESLQQLAGRPFKLFLKKQTSSKLKAILGGAVVTGILQSSSVVNLMVLAFVGANVIQMQNALAVILGSNLGTTLDSWIVASIGFQFNIEQIAFPVVGISGIVMLLSDKESRWYPWSKFLFGFGFLFIGLNYMKSGMEEAVKQVDLSSFSQYPPVIFLFLGFLITALIQSSSATIAIVLSALYIHAISLLDASAIVLGSEVGTTMKLLLASVKGLPAKKRVALGNLLFNSIIAVLIFIFLFPVNRFIKETIGIKDNLLALVFFQSLVNILSIFLFYPLLPVFGRFLEQRFRGRAADEKLSIHTVNASDTAPAILALEKDVKKFIIHTIDFTGEVFSRPGKNHGEKSIPDRYQYLKQLHGEIYAYAIQMRKYVFADKESTARLEQLVSVNRNAMYAAKSIKDALPDVTQLRKSSNDVKFAFYQQVAEEADVFCKKISVLLLQQNPGKVFDELSKLYLSVTEGYPLMLQQLYKENTQKRIMDIEVSTLINFNRQMYTAYKSLFFAVKDYLLPPEQAVSFDELPGFIR